MLTVREILARWLVDDCKAMGARPLTITIGRTEYEAAEYWKVNSPLPFASNQNNYVQHMIYVVGERHWMSHREYLYRIGVECWYTASYCDFEHIDSGPRERAAKFQPYGPMFQLMPVTFEHNNRPTEDVTLSLGDMIGNMPDITLEDAVDWRGDTVTNGVMIDGILSHEVDIPITQTWLDLEPYTDIIEHYKTDYTKHDKLSLWVNNPDRFLFLVRSTGTWLLPVCKLHDDISATSYSGILRYAVRHERDRTTFYAYDHGKISQISPNDCYSLVSKWRAELRAIERAKDDVMWLDRLNNPDYGYTLSDAQRMLYNGQISQNVYDQYYDEWASHFRYSLS